MGLLDWLAGLFSGESSDTDRTAPPIRGTIAGAPRVASSNPFERVAGHGVGSGLKRHSAPSGGVIGRVSGLYTEHQAATGERGGKMLARYLGTGAAGEKIGGKLGRWAGRTEGKITVKVAGKVGGSLHGGVKAIGHAFGF